jgi:hypothetical protein
MHLKLSDQQICTLFFIAERSPRPPRDMDRFPNVRMFLREGLIRFFEPFRQRLVITELFPYQEYKQSTPKDVLPFEGMTTFDELEQANKLVFAPEEDLTRGHTFRIYETVLLRRALRKLDATMGDFSKGEYTLICSQDPEKYAAAERLVDEWMDRVMS